MSPRVTPPRSKPTCPECHRAPDAASYPFCSPRCKAVDLHRWLIGAYVIPGATDEVGSLDESEE